MWPTRSDTLATCRRTDMHVHPTLTCHPPHRPPPPGLGPPESPKRGKGDRRAPTLGLWGSHGPHYGCSFSPTVPTPRVHRWLWWLSGRPSHPCIPRGQCAPVEGVCTSGRWGLHHCLGASLHQGLPQGWPGAWGSHTGRAPCGGLGHTGEPAARAAPGGFMWVRPQAARGRGWAAPADPAPFL